MLQRHGFIVGGVRRESPEYLTVRSPYSRQAVAEVCRAQPDDIEEAVSLAAAAFEKTRRLASYERFELLRECSRRLGERTEEMARTITAEVGKPIVLARHEARRTVEIFSLAAEESRRIGGEVIPLDWNPTTRGALALNCRVPLGPIYGITPFNFPLNLVSHKVAPALAAGNSIVIRPSSAAPISALLLGEIVSGCGFPAGTISVLPCSTALGEAMARDERFKLLTFTGSPAVGWYLKSIAGRKRVTLELGGNAATLVDETADLARAASRCAYGAFAFSGQVCISVQRIFIQESVFSRFCDLFLTEVAKLRPGDPFDEQTTIGPLIDERAAERTEGWINEAVAGGAMVLAGGQRSGGYLPPTVLTGTLPGMKVNCCEAFAPLVTVEPYSDPLKALALANDSIYGLQAGIFTRNAEFMMRAFRELDVGGVIINDIPTLRLDHMPYGGVKQSGQGREGVRSAIEEMTEPKLLALNFGAEREPR
ncbi:MAG: aldehyde dehydrogenase family protein [Pseudomonadota bacterium]